jgi:hypothetical protein
MDFFGRTVDFEQFQGQFVYIQFFHSLPLAKEEEIKGIGQELKNYSIITVVFVLPENIKPRVDYPFQNIYYIYDTKGQIHRQLNAPSCCDSYQIYNQQKELMRRGLIESDYRKQVHPLLVEALERKIQYFDIHFKLDKIEESGLPADLAQMLGFPAQKKANHFVGLVSSICSVCPVAKIIEQANGTYCLSPDSYSFAILLSNDFNDIDLSNFRSSFAIKIPVMKAAPRILSTWNQLRANFPGLFDDIFIVIDQQGEITNFLDDQGNADTFLKYLESYCRKQ